MTDDRPRKVRVSDRRVVRPEEVGAGPGAGPQPSPASELEELEQELRAQRKLAEERLDQLKRMKAEFANTRQRMIREQTEIVDRASRRVVERLLPVLDDFERALEAARTQPGADASFVRGVELVFRKLQEVLASEGLERVEAEGRPFDPREHEALTSEVGEVREPTVLEVVRPGYRLKGKMLRPALVRVATPPSEEAGAEAAVAPPQTLEGGEAEGRPAQAAGEAPPPEGR